MTLPILEPEHFAALSLFAFASSITPGPNNMMLLASGANFGLKRTLPHWLGVVFGFSGLCLAVGLGLGGLFAAYPMLHTILKWGGAAYLVWLAWKIGSSRQIAAGKASGKPMTFLAAVAFQAINVKAWAMALGLAATYVPAEGYIGNLLIGCLVFAVINAPCVACWLSFGIALRRFLDRPAALRAFNITMAALLLLSLYPVFFSA
jgi:threonine/homoserine/homoserine lactone efflux protein